MAAGLGSGAILTGLIVMAALAVAACGGSDTGDEQAAADTATQADAATATDTVRADQEEPAAATAANVEIGEYTCVCMGTMIIQRRTIGAHSLIGAGSVVIRDIPPSSVAYGVPARVVHQRTKNKRHMG